MSPNIEDLIARLIRHASVEVNELEDDLYAAVTALKDLSERVKELEAGIDPFARYGRIHRAMREASARTTMPTRGTLFGLSSVHGDADIDVKDFDRAVALAGDAQ